MTCTVQAYAVSCSSARRSCCSCLGRSVVRLLCVLAGLLLELAWLRLTPGCGMQASVLLGLRHLIVVDAQNRIVGIITRKDLDHAAGHGWWRMSAQAPKPNRKQPPAKKGVMNRCAGSVGTEQGLAGALYMTVPDLASCFSMCHC
eukprot:GHUV01040524.1.p1 GENE.GHUV01040524.1~~GHUV01040524.1.p1  ORF type:complete len:145 (-),score=23.94 GHUV01040524.1:267-701(-)